MKKEKYVNDVLKNIDADKKMRNRIKEDLYQRIEMAEENDPFFDILKEIGHPVEVAKEFNQNLELPNTYVVTTGLSFGLNVYEYQSKLKIFGVPFLHINVGGRYQTRQARGIIAFGDVAFGVISVGGVAVGGVSLGGVGVGLVAFGGVAVGGVAFGGVAVGAIAFGAVALGFAKVVGALKYILG